MEMLANQRLRQFVNWLKINGRVKSDSNFASVIHYDRSAVSEILGSKRIVTRKFVDTVCCFYPELNRQFLEDENCAQMLTGENSSTNIINSTIARNGQVTIGNRTITSDDIAAIIKNFEERCEDKERVIINLQQQIERLTGIIAAMASGNDKA